MKSDEETRPRGAVLALALALAACAPAPAAPSIVVPQASSARAMALAPPPRAPAPRLAPSAGTVTATLPAPIPLVDEPSPFVLAAHGTDSLLPMSSGPDVALYPLSGALFLRAGAHLAQLGPKGFVPSTLLEKAAPRGWGVITLFGAWPKSAFAQLRPTAGNGRTLPGALYRVTERSLTLVHAVDIDADYLGAWYDGHGRIGAVFTRVVDRSVATGIEVLEGKKEGKPQLADRPDGEARLEIFDLASFDSGHLLLFGMNRSAPEVTFDGIERFAPGESTGTFERVPTPPGAGVYLEQMAMTAGSPTLAWVAGLATTSAQGPQRPYLARWDGVAWTPLDMPAPGPQAHGRPRIAASPEGDLWIGWDHDDTGGEILHRKLDGTWSRVALPAPPPASQATPRQLLALTHHDGELWLVTSPVGAKPRFAVYRTRPGGEVLQLKAVTR